MFYYTHILCKYSNLRELLVSGRNFVFVIETSSRLNDSFKNRLKFHNIFQNCNFKFEIFSVEPTKFCKKNIIRLLITNNHT